MSAATTSGTLLAAVRRLYRPLTKDVFYSYDKPEIKRAVQAGYVDQGTAFYAATKTTGCLQPVYSYYRSRLHRFAATSAERTQLKREGWKEEKVRFYLGKADKPCARLRGVSLTRRTRCYSDSDTNIPRAAPSGWLDTHAVAQDQLCHAHR